MKKILLSLVIVLTSLLLVACTSKPKVEDNKKPEEEIVEDDLGLFSKNTKVFYNDKYKSHTIKTLELAGFENEEPTEEGFFDHIELTTKDQEKYEVSNIKFTIKATGTLYLQVVVGQNNGEEVISDIFELTNETKDFSVDKIMLDYANETKAKTSILNISFIYYFELEEGKKLDTKLTGAKQYYNALSNGGFNGVTGKNVEGNGLEYKLELYNLSYDIKLA